MSWTLILLGVELSSDWFGAKKLEIEPNTVSSYRNDLENHLLPFFKDHHLSQISVEEVDRYRQDIGRDKTEAGMREVEMLALLREILIEHRQQKIREGLPTGPDDPVLLTSTGKARDRHNLGKDVVEPVVRRAEELLAERGAQPLPKEITPHKLRHTFASILVAIGRDPIDVMTQLGHTDPAFTLRVYSHMMRRSPAERERLKALVEGRVWSHIGHKTADSASPATDRADA